MDLFFHHNHLLISGNDDDLKTKGDSFSEVKNSQSNEQLHLYHARSYKVFEERTNHGNFKHQPQRHECDRVCSKDEKPKDCHYKFIIEQHTSMGKVQATQFCFVRNL